MNNINKNQDSFKDIKKAIRKALNPLRKYVKENLVSIKAPNGVIIIIDKAAMNDFIMSDDEVSKIVEELKREIINIDGKDVSANDLISNKDNINKRVIKNSNKERIDSSNEIGINNINKERNNKVNERGVSEN